MDEKDPILKIKNLSKNYGKKFAVKNFSLELTKGEIVGLIGPNGAGKTTLMRTIVGLIKKYTGTIQFNDKAASTKNIGAIIETPKFYNNLSGFDNLIYFSSFNGNVSKEKIYTIVDKLGLKSDIERKVKGYSMGMKQRLGLILALISSPDLLILDEPLNGLDPKGVHEIRNYLTSLVKENTTSILISSHILSEIEKICDRVIFIKDGLFIEEIKDVNKRNYDLEEKFLRIMEA